MRNFGIWIFVLLLPILAALGHDAYATYKDEDFDKAMMFSDVGYLWTTYDPGTYQWAQQNIDQSLWDSMLTPLLEQTTVLIAAVPLAVGLIVFAVIALIRVTSLPRILRLGSGQSNSDYNNAAGKKSRNKNQSLYRRK